MPKILFPMKAIRAKCLDCSGTSKAVKYCPCDGLTETRCELWPFRFGMRVPRATKLHGKEFLTPGRMRILRWTNCPHEAQGAQKTQGSLALNEKLTENALRRPHSTEQGD